MGRAAFEGDFYTGYEPRECGDHRSTGSRAWCFECSEWCYPRIPCKGCEIEGLRDRVVRIDRTMVPVEQLRAAIRQLFPDEMTPLAKSVLESICDQAEHGPS